MNEPETLKEMKSRHAEEDAAKKDAAKTEAERELTPVEQISKLWKSLDEDTMALIYKLEPGVLIAWDRGDFGVVVKLILSNESEELKPLRDKILPLLPKAG